MFFNSFPDVEENSSDPDFEESESLKFVDLASSLDSLPLLISVCREDQWGNLLGPGHIVAHLHIFRLIQSTESFINFLVPGIRILSRIFRL